VGVGVGARGGSTWAGGDYLRGALGWERRANLRTTNKARLHTHTQAQATQPLHRGPQTSMPTAFQHFRPFRTKSDDGGRHRRRRQVNRVFMSWRFGRPDFPDLESHNGCRASGPEGRYFPPSEVTLLIVVLPLALRVRPAVQASGACRGSTPLSVARVGGPSLVVLRCGDRGHPIDTRAVDCGSPSSSPLDGGALPFEIPGTSRVTHAPPAGDLWATPALGVLALVGGGRAVPVGGGGTVAGESISPPEDADRTPTTGARPPPGAGRTCTLAEAQRGGVGAHPSPLDGQRPAGAPPFDPPRVEGAGSSAGTWSGGTPAGLGPIRPTKELSLEEDE